MTRGSFSDESLWENTNDVFRSGPDPESLLEGLTGPQREAVTQRGGPLLVIAGAGSGKTRVLTRRIAHILATGTLGPARSWPSRSPTRRPTRCADEWSNWWAPSADQMWVSTFHSACLRMLRGHADVLGYERGFTIYDAGDAETAVERIMKETQPRH